MSLPTRQIGGHKAAINNPNVSEEAKEHSRQVIQDLEGSADTQATRDEYQDGKDPARVNAGYKATLNNPNVSQEAKDEARQKLEANGAI